MSAAGLVHDAVQQSSLDAERAGVDVHVQVASDLPSLLAGHAQARPEATALRLGEMALSYRALHERVDRVAAMLQHSGGVPRDVVAICAATSIDYVAVFLGALRAVKVPTCWRAACPHCLRFAI